ncbi:MAG: amphi-Trp domain-containing protein [Desulfobacterales bacterium]|jgi:amphi-Trp domain-containing protein|nr:amphi-Trp domain-containing protein [Desulfobacterales bacterium]
MKESKISHNQHMKREDLVSYLENLIASIKTGKIVIERNGRFVSLTPPNSVNLELQAKTKKDKGELSIEISWRQELEEPVKAPLNISSNEPEIIETGEASEESQADETAVE